MRSLSDREEEVVSLILQGKSNKQIALALGISERTVEFHLDNIYRKNEVNSRVELILKLGKTTGSTIINQLESTVEHEEPLAHNSNEPDAGDNPVHPSEKPHPAKGFEVVMTAEMKKLLSGITVIFGVVLMIGGIVKDMFGAVVVGVISTTLALLQWIRSNKAP